MPLPVSGLGMHGCACMLLHSYQHCCSRPALAVWAAFASRCLLCDQLPSAGPFPVSGSGEQVAHAWCSTGVPICCSQSCTCYICVLPRCLHCDQLAQPGSSRAPGCRCKRMLPSQSWAMMAPLSWTTSYLRMSGPLCVAWQAACWAAGTPSASRRAKPSMQSVDPHTVLQFAYAQHCQEAFELEDLTPATVRSTGAAWQAACWAAETPSASRSATARWHTGLFRLYT